MLSYFGEYPLFQANCFRNNNYFFNDWNQRWKIAHNYLDEMMFDLFNINLLKQTKESSEAKHEKLADSSSNQKPKDDLETTNELNNENLKNEYFYSSVTQNFYDKGNVSHIIKKVTDNEHGTIFIETRKLGNKSITLKREVGKDEQICETETRENISDNEIEEFEKEWRNIREKTKLNLNEKPQSLPGIEKNKLNK